jgi:hypothetical protein
MTAQNNGCKDRDPCCFYRRRFNPETDLADIEAMCGQRWI